MESGSSQSSITDTTAAATVTKPIEAPFLQIPYLVNGHAFTKTDMYNQSKTTYEKEPKPNHKFCGKTFHEFAMDQSEWLRTEYDNIYLFDGDTVEFTTLNFYKASPETVIEEIKEQHERFIQEINSVKYPKNSYIHGILPLRIQTANHPFATYTTNLKNISMFNNGTIHINITLPTKLNADAKIEDWPAFEKKHRILARLIQYAEPFLIARFGTPDPFSKAQGKASKHQYNFGGASQRLAVSRYIGAGTFDTTAMKHGKILQVERSALPWNPNTSKGGWYPDDETWGYEPLNTIG
ncbi:MAG: hypothetical protein EB127_17740, partial [Alphaproteobacteria bacterium]|nr:hypothetical protein [Alphaproteobacteria bacterium]